MGVIGLITQETQESQHLLDVVMSQFEGWIMAAILEPPKRQSQRSEGGQPRAGEKPGADDIITPLESHLSPGPLVA